MTIFIRLVGDQNSGASGVDKFAFTQPTVADIQPPGHVAGTSRVGKMGDVIRVTGSNLGDNLDAIQVYINGRISTRVVIITAHKAFTFKVGRCGYLYKRNKTSLAIACLTQRPPVCVAL
jgi:hypothetical protein